MTKNKKAILLTIVLAEKKPAIPVAFSAGGCVVNIEPVADETDDDTFS